MEGETSVKKNSFLRQDKIALYLVFAALIITPLIFWPVYNFSLEVVKKFFVVTAVVVALVLWFWGRLKEKRLIIPKSNALAVGGLFLVIAAISALTSNAIRTSLLGLGFESGTVFSLIIFFGLMFLASQYLKTKKYFLNAYIGIFAVFCLVFLFQLVRYLFGNFLPWPIYDNSAVNLIGKWNDFGVLAGLITLCLVVILDFFPLKGAKILKIFLWLMLVASLVALFLVNFYLIWIILAVLLFVIYAYDLSFISRKENRLKKFGKLSAIVFLIAASFLIFGHTLTYDAQGQPHEGFLAKEGRLISEKLKISSLEVRPSFLGTYSLEESSLKDHPVLGVGPQLFSEVWLKYKPAGVNDTQFWNILPSYGVGFIPTFFITTGLLGGLVLVIFALLLLYAGVKVLLNPKIELLDKTFIFLSFVSVAYFWILLFCYVPETSILTLIFIVTGLFIARLADVGHLKKMDLSLAANPKIKFISSLSGAVVALILVVIVLGWGGSLLAIAMVQKGNNDLARGQADSAEKDIKIAIMLNPQDVYYQTATQVNLAQMNSLLSQKLPQDQLMAAYSKIYDRAKQNVDAAVSLDKENYQNYLARGGLYENIMNLGVTGAYDLAKQNYDTAISLNPSGPDMYLLLARLEISNKNYTDAEKYLDQSLALKKDFVDAIYLQSQLYAERGYLSSAVKRAEYAATLAPNDPGILFQLGYLKYRNADYKGSAEAMQAAVNIVPNYANALYFLGLSLDKLGQTDQAIKAFTLIDQSNPGNAEIEKILANLKNGKDALSSAGDSKTDTTTKSD